MNKSALRRILFLFIFLTLSVLKTLAVNDPKYPNHPSINFPFSNSDLPVVIIDLEEKMADKSEDRRVPAKMKIVWNRNGERNNMDETNSENINYDGAIGIKYRGNTSYTFSNKKPFSLKLQNSNGDNLKHSILGMEKDDDWVLMAPFSDKSLIRDILLFELMKGTFPFTPSGRYCELILNGVYQGVYILTERVRQGSERIDIKKPTANSGDGLTGGYHLEIDGDDHLGF